MVERNNRIGRTLIWVCLIIVALVAVVVIMSGNATKVAEPSTTRVEWESVNVRTNHNTRSEVLTSLVRGETVHLTGKTFEVFGGETAGIWAEVQINGKVGWVYASALTH